MWPSCRLVHHGSQSFQRICPGSGITFAVSAKMGRNISIGKSGNLVNSGNLGTDGMFSVMSIYLAWPDERQGCPKSTSSDRLWERPVCPRIISRFYLGLLCSRAPGAAFGFGFGFEVAEKALECVLIAVMIFPVAEIADVPGPSQAGGPGLIGCHGRVV